MKDERSGAILLKTHTVLKSAGNFFTQSCTDRKVKRRLLCRGVFLFVSGWEVPSAADSLGAIASSSSPSSSSSSSCRREILHRNTWEGAYHREKMLFQIENVNAISIALILLHSFALNRGEDFSRAAIL